MDSADDGVLLGTRELLLRALTALVPGGCVLLESLEDEPGHEEDAQVEDNHRERLHLDDGDDQFDSRICLGVCLVARWRRVAVPNPAL